MCRELESRGWRVLYHDVKIWRTQVDIVARAPDDLLTLVEVKNHSGDGYFGAKQKFRLFKIAQFLAEFEPVQLVLAFVRVDGIEFIPVDGVGGDMGHL